METGITLRILLLSIMAVIVVELTAVFSASSTDLSVLAAIGLARFIDTVLIVIILVVLGRGLSSIGLVFSSMMVGVKRGLAWAGLFTGLALMAWAALMILGVDPLSLLRMPLPPTTGELLLVVLAAGLLGPIAEELFFRGVIFGYFRPWGFPVALAASSLLFAMAHLVTIPIPVVQLLGGLILAALYEREKNLMVPIVVHVVGNMVIILISL